MIQNMCFFLCTAHGNSSTFYGGSPSDGLPFQGVCQGNGAGPTLWLATSIPLIEMLHHHGHVSFFQCPISGTLTSLVGILYVDNCDLFVFLPLASHSQQAIQALQENIRLWEGGIHATSRSLALKNALGVYSPLHKGNCWLTHSNTSAPAKFTISEGTGQHT